MNRPPNGRSPCPRLTSHTIETPLPECRRKRICPPDRQMSAEPPAVQFAGYRIAGRMPCPDEDRNAGRIVRGGPDRMAQCRRPYRPPAARRTVDPVPDHSRIASCVWSKCVRGITNSGSEAPSHGRTEKSNGPRKERRLPKRPLPVRPVLPRCCPLFEPNCTGETSSALLLQQVHDTGPADRSGMTKRSPPPIVGTFGAVDPCDIGPCIRCEPHIGPGRIFGDRRRRPFARLLIRYARRHVSGHRSRFRVECPSATDVQDAEAYGRTRSGFEQRFEGTAADPFRLCGGQGGDPKTNGSPAFGPDASRQSSAKR